MHIDFIIISDLMRESKTQIWMNEEEQQVWTNDEYPGVSESMILIKPYDLRSEI